MLSIGKLARMASYTRSQVEEVNQVPQQLLMVDERLDIVASHDHLLNLSRSILDPRDLLKPVETQATVLLGRLCSHVTNAEVMKVSSGAMYSCRNAS